MASALLDISSLPSLRRAWNYIDGRANGSQRNSSGVDNESINDFATHTERNLCEIRSALKRTAGYVFSGLRAHLIPKSDGGIRVISVPTVRDRVVQRAILDYLSDGDRCGLINNVSYGFVRSRNVEMAVRHAKNLRRSRPYAYKTDITGFFDKLDRTVLEGKLKERIRQRSLHDLLIAAANCDIEEYRPARVKKIHAAGIREGQGVRQGMAISPFYANLFLNDFDHQAETRGFKMIRYADDFVVFAKTRQECESIDDFCRSQLGLLRLDIPSIGATSKTKIYGPDEDAAFLGVGIVRDGKAYTIRILPNQFKEIEKRFLAYSDIDKLIRERVTLASLAKRLEGSIAGYLGAYDFCDNKSDLEKALLQWRKKIFARVFNQLGVNIHNLSDEKQRFVLG